MLKINKIIYIKMKTYFTITAGRSGSAWLAKFLELNLDIEVIHEPLGIDDFGTKMPDIRTLRNFNNYGNNDFVKKFWINKLNNLDGKIYAETNHTLAKCGLIENLVKSNLAKNSTVFILKRNLAKQCLSYLTRGDFGNITLIWQWFLHPSYKLKIVNPDHFKKFNSIGLPLWYCYELAARQEYYVQKYSDKIKFIEISLEEITSVDGALKLLKELDVKDKCEIPAPQNKNFNSPNIDIQNMVNNVVKSINFDVESIVKNIIKKGFSFE